MNILMVIKSLRQEKTSQFDTYYLIINELLENESMVFKDKRELYNYLVDTYNM